MSIDRQKVIDTAQKYAAKGQFDKAIAEYMRIVKEDPSDVRILLKIGDLQVRKGAKEDAIATYSRVARSYDEQGFFLKAIAVYKQILSIDPSLTELYTKLADLYVKLGLIPDALAHLDALASRYARAGQDEKLVGVYRQMVQIDPNNVVCRIKLAELLSKLGRNEEAAQEFEAGANLLKEAGRLDDWAKVAERLLYHRPSDAALAKQLAKHYIDRQDARRALPKLQVCFKANPKDIETLEMLAVAFRELAQLPKTISVLKEIARIHQENGEQDKRLETYRRVLELSPNDAEAKEALRTASRLARPPSAPEPRTESAPVTHKRVPPPPVKPAVSAQVPPTTSSSATAAEDEEEEVILVEEAEVEAVQDLEPPSTQAPRSSVPSQAIPPRPAVPAVPSPPSVHSPTDPSAEVTRILGEADIFLKYGLKQKAIAHLLRALEIHPDALDVHVRLRDLYAEQGDTAGTVRHSLRIAEILAESDPASAVAEVTRALEIDPDNAAALELFQRLGGVVAEHPAEGYEVQDYEGYAQGSYATEQAYAGGTEGGEYGEHTARDAYESPVVQDSRRSADRDVASVPPAGTGSEIEEGLDEAEFFITQGLYDEARETLQSLLQAHPGHPLVIDRLEELEALVQAQMAPADDRSFALAEKLAEEVDNVAHSGDPHFNAGGEMIDVETVFAQFKKGVEKTISPDDADTHYDLGIAYKEMGLLDDAISEFKIAAQNPKKSCLAETMIGLCNMERGDVGAAIEHFKRALQSPSKSEREEIGLYFELGNAYETVGDLSEALYFFQKVEKRDPSFRGVRERIQKLTAQMQQGGRSQRPSLSEIDEVDRAFDELLKG